jgi:beta-glucosidase
LPITFYKSVDQLPPFEDYSMAKRTYRYFDGEALYPFGYGLSYTSFVYSNPHLESDSVPATGTVNLSVDVANNGRVAGDEVVQLYLTHAAVAGAPLYALKGFQRIHLDPGKHQPVTFTLRDRDLSIVDDAGKHRIVPGKVQLWIGGGQPKVREGLPKPSGVASEFVITTEATLPD